MNDSAFHDWPVKPFFELEPAESAYETSRTVIIPAPYEGTVCFGHGASLGPRKILEASYLVELYDVILGREIHHQGVHDLAPLALSGPPEDAVSAVRTAVAQELSRGKFPVVVGGEHSLTLGAVQAAREKHPGLCVLQLDAHADLRQEFSGSIHSHACVMRRIAELHVPFVGVGIRSMCLEEAQWIREHQPKIFYAHRMREDKDWMPKVIDALADTVYLTLDLDVLDPAEMPSTGTPEPGGLSYYDLVYFLLALFKSGKRIVAADLMELAPIPGLLAPDFLAAKILYLICAKI